MSKQSALTTLAQQLNINEGEVQSLVTNTLMKAKDGKQPTNEELITFLAIASEYRLNPLTKEIYAFANRGAIQPIVSIDGWLKIINQHPQFDGMEFVDNVAGNSSLDSVTCKIYRKDRSRPTEVTEYMAECKGVSEPWKRWPARMLRHKATIQAARYAFGLSGIVDPDEAERIQSSEEKYMGAAQTVKTTDQVAQALPYYPADGFEEQLATWQSYIDAGRATPERIIATVESKYQLSEDQKAAINALVSNEVAA
ncbi:phage recombination protein Bet [Paenalcaligenes hominis]|uniref:Phage recombination protein Bet n=1 Tax=Paenalcaligenes hominis TaxID=643674 RepID=A0ABX0WM38_9BURK|nr:recombinase RecT [Paenalcaligenes hominis]NJB64302.1 phage recombination protein Bet [Paenalcaligenes hominis]GGE68675.1 hypothetical protein GCM10007278_15970 [Paenalcaligenes hominis]